MAGRRGGTTQRETGKRSGAGANTDPIRMPGNNTQASLPVTSGAATSATQRAGRGSAAGRTSGSRSPKQREAGATKATARRGVGRNATAERAGSSPAKAASLPMLRTSERSTLKRCEFQWHITYERRLKTGVDLPALRFGSLAHKALAGWYVKGIKRGVHPAKGFERAYKADMERNQQLFGARMEEDDRWVDALELGVAMMNNYVDEYGNDDLWEVLVTEQPFQVVVNQPVEARWSGPKPDPWFIYTGVMDGIWRNRASKELWIPDHKTTASLSDSKLAYLQMDDQAGAYWSFGVDWMQEKGLLKPGQKLNGMLYNFLRKAMPDERQSKFVKGKRLYTNLDGSISKKQPAPYFMRMPIFRDEYDRAMARLRAQNDYDRIVMLHEGTLPIGKSPGQFTCPGCPVKDICELHETGADYNEFIGQTCHVWDPYAEHEVYDGR